MKLIKNGEVYAPEYLGKKDILLAAGKIIKIADQIEEKYDFCKVIDADGKIVVPGLMDGHVHIVGGGGEAGFYSQAPEIQLSALTSAGITTVLGLLGTDGITRDVERLYAKCHGLNEEGISCYMITGSYSYPSINITGSVKKDIVFMDECLGCKLAISDHRSSHISRQQLIELASDCRLAGMISGKAGYLCLHMGDDPQGLEEVMDICVNTSIPVKIFQPTHVGRNPKLFRDAIQFAKMGGFVDLTVSTKENETVRKIQQMMDEGTPMDKVTISSDGQGSWSNYDEAGNLTAIGIQSVDYLYKDFVSLAKNFGLEFALPMFTTNVANRLQLKDKGALAQGKDADMLILNKDYSLNYTIAKGKIMVQDGTIIVKGTYEG